MATLLEGENEEREMGFKTLTRQCLRSYLQLNNELSGTSLSDSDWDISHIEERLRRFLGYYQKMVGGENVVSKILITPVGSSEEGQKEWRVESEWMDFVLSKADLNSIRNILEKLRILMNEGYVNEEFPTEDTHFHLYGEERIVTSMALLEADEIRSEGTFDYDNTWIPSQIFRRNAIEAIKKGNHNHSTGEGVKIESLQTQCFIVGPTSPFSDEHSFGFQILNLIPCKKGELLADENKYYVPSVKRYKFPTIKEAIRSLIVEYFVEHGDFNRFAICQQCGSLYLEQQEGYTKYCSKECNLNHYKESTPKDKSNCRERQRNWYANHYIGDAPISIKSNECDDCNLDYQRNGGDCEVLWEKYGQGVLEWFEVEKGESAYTYMCRQRQLSFHSEKLGRKKTSFGNKKTCQGCDVFLPKEQTQIPEPGTCQKILTKQKIKRVNQSGVQSVAVYTNILGTDFLKK